MLVFYLLVSLMPMDQQHFWGTFVVAGTLIKYVGLACVFYAAFHLAVRGAPPPFLSTRPARIFLLFLPLIFASYWFLGPKFYLRTSVFMSALSIGFLFFVVLSIVDTLPRLRWTLLTAVGAMGFTSLYVFREWMKDPYWRPGSVSGDANYFALNGCLVLPLAFVLLFRSRVPWERLLALGSIVITVVCTVLAASRGGLLGLGAAFLWLIWYSPRRFRNTVLLFIVSVPLLVLLPSSPLRRLISPKASDVTGEVARLVAWKAGLRMIEHHPLTGVGLGEFKPQMPFYTDRGAGVDTIAHNTYLEVAAETGLPTFLIFLALLFSTYRGLSRVRRQTVDSSSPLMHLAATGIQAGFVGYLVGCFFLSAEYQKLFWLWVFLAMCLPSLVPPAEHERATGPRWAAEGAESWSSKPIGFGPWTDAPSSQDRDSPRRDAEWRKEEVAARGHSRLGWPR